MKLRVLILAALVLAASFGLANAQTISVDHVDGLAAPGAVNMEVPITFHIRMAAEGAQYAGITNGFHVYSPSGASWTGTAIDTTGTIGQANFELIWSISHHSITGSDADTVGLAGAVMMSPFGMDADFNDITHTITIGPIGTADAGGEICLDSAFYRNSGVWKWAGRKPTYPDVKPNWGGPYCYTIGEIVIDPPVVECPTEPVTLDLCAVQDTCFDLAITDANSVVVTGDIAGATWADNKICFTAPATEGPYNVHIEATNDGGMVPCDVTVSIGYPTQPAITCPADTIDVSLCTLEEVCVELLIADAATVEVSGDGAWANDTLCFTPTGPGTYEFTVTAHSDAVCDLTDECVVTVTVDVAESPVIACPADTGLVTECAPGNYCLSLDITGSDTVRVYGGTWEAGQLCFDASTSGVMTFEVAADNCAGTDSCTVWVEVDLNDAPAVNLVDIDPATFCKPTAVVMDYTTSDQDLDDLGEAVLSPAGAVIDTIANTVTFTPDVTGIYEVIVEVTDLCGVTTADTSSVDITIIVAPEIDCPLAPIDRSICTVQEICVDLPITDAFMVDIVGDATWSADQLCFTPDTAGSYQFIVTAHSEEPCALSYQCVVTVNVDIAALPAITCPIDTALIEGCDPGNYCTSLDITGADDVRVHGGGTWADGQLCFDATTSGVMTFEVAVENCAGTDSCTVYVLVDLNSAPTVDVVDLAPQAIPAPAPIILAYTTDDADGDITLESVLSPAGATIDTLANTITFTPMTTGLYTVVAQVTDLCGATGTDTSLVNVQIVGAPDIDCPDGPVVVQMDAGDLWCIDLAVSDADDVWIEGATADWVVSWSADQLCFDASVPGDYGLTLVAYRSVGGESRCPIDITVEDNPCPNPPVIACPTEIWMHEVCGNPVNCECCFYLPIEYAGEVTIDLDGATWANDTLCIPVDTLGFYTIQVTAHGVNPGCEPAICDIEIMIEQYTCSDIILSDNEFHFSRLLSDMSALPSQFLTVSSTDDPFCFNIIQSSGFDWFSVAPTGCTDAPITIAVDPYGLEVGVYSTVVALDASGQDVCDPPTEFFTVYLEVLPDVSEEDVLHIPTVPTVPGARVGVPITIEHPCDLDALSARFKYYTDQFEFDSASFAGSQLADWTELSVSVVDRAITVTASAGDGTILPPGAGTALTLWFTVDHMAYQNFHAIEAFDAIFTIDCYNSSVFEPVEATVIPGGLIIGPLEDYICGYVVDPDMNAIEGATIELWADFPVGSAAQMTSSNPTGLFEFFNTSVIPFDLYAHKEGYYPATVENLDFNDNGVLIVLTPIEDVFPTDQWVNFYCQSNLFMNEAMPIGSVIDAFDPDGIHCGTFTVSETGAYGFMPVYHDDPYTAGIDEGAEVGDIIRLYVNGIEAFPMYTPMWTGNGAVHEICLDISNDVPHSCDLVEGWNLVSWQVDTENDEIESVLASIADDIDVVLAFKNGGLTWDPDLPLFSNLSHVDHMSGYWVKTTSPVTLEIRGRAVPATTPIMVDEGWNLVSYLPSPAEDPEIALASLAAGLQAVLGYDSGYEEYVPGDVVHQTLESMYSCHGYWIRVDRPSTLIYPGSGPVVAPQISRQPAALAKVTSDFQMTQNWMNIYATELRLDDKPISAGASISAHNSAGTMVGGFTLMQDGLFGFMAVYGDDETTSKLDGVRPGDSFTLRIDGIETNESFTWTQNGDRVEIGSLTAKSGSDAGLPGEFQLLPNYPNPFNPSTVIGFSLPTAGKAKLVVFNILGRQVATVFDAEASAGYNEVSWDGRADDGGQVSSGVYFYRLTTESFTETRKMMLLK